MPTDDEIQAQIAADHQRELDRIAEREREVGA